MASTAVLAGFGCGFDRASSSVDYVVLFDHIQQHEVSISATFAGIQSDEPFEILMSRTSPGTYSLHEFISNVNHVNIFDGKGGRLDFVRPDPYRWVVPAHNGTVTISYTLYGNHANGTFNGFERSFAHFNMPASFVWAPSMVSAPIYLHIEPQSSNWEAATQLSSADHPFSFEAPNWAYFVDSPLRMGSMSRFVKSFGPSGSRQEVHIALQHEGTNSEGALWSENLWHIVQTQMRIFGELPRYDGGRYTFMAAFSPHVYDDGIAHRNSSVITCNCTLGDGGKSHLQAASHAFFHQWNLERIRPNQLEPFSLQEVSMSDVLWFTEGFTSYYQDLTLRRAGITTNAEYANLIAARMNGVRLSAGSGHRSLVEMSQRAAFEHTKWMRPETLNDMPRLDGELNVDGELNAGRLLDGYSLGGRSRGGLDADHAVFLYDQWGSVVGLFLDLTLRVEFDTDLDAFMQLLWHRFGAQEIPYSIRDLEQALAEVSGNTVFARAFFDQYVYANHIPDLTSLLARVGFMVRPTHTEKRFMGAQLNETPSGLKVAHDPMRGSPFWEAGLNRGDIVHSMNGVELKSLSDWENLLSGSVGYTPWRVVFESVGETIQREVGFQPNQSLEVVVLEEVGEIPSAEVLTERQKWLWE